MLGRWFGKRNKLKDADPEVRLAAVQGLPDDQSTDLVDVARSDEDTAVRLAATERLTDTSALLDLIADPSVGETAACRLAKQVEANTSDKKLLDTLGQPQVLVQYIAHASPEHLGVCVPYLEEPSNVAQAAVRARGDLKQALIAHAAVSTEAGLQVLEKASRGRDKQINQHARRSLQQSKERKSAIAAAEARLEEIDAAIQKTLTSEETSSSQKLKSLHKSWQGVVAELINLDAARPTATDPLAEFDFAELEAKEDHALVAAIEEIRAHLETGNYDAAASTQTLLQHKLASFESPSVSLIEQTASVEAQLASVKGGFTALDSEPWQTYARPAGIEDKPPTARLSKAIRERKDWTAIWQRQLKSFAWPPGLPEPAQIETCRSDLSAVQQEIEQLQGIAQVASSHLQQHLDAVATALDDNQYQQAVRAIKKARNLHRDLDDLQPRKEKLQTERQLAALSTRIDELKDWQKFATNPKRDALLGELQTIAATPLQPAAQASRLKKLRSEWQALGHPTSSEEREQQATFDQFAEQAYEPCKAYFADQEKLRQENLLAREGLCQQLQDYLDNTDWEQADYKAAEQIMRTARDEWRHYHPCDRKAIKPLQKRFDQLQERLHAHVKEAWDANIAVKRGIIEETRTLLEQPIENQVEGAKTLQQRWRDVGPVPRSADQRLWKDFRALCDQIFNQRDTAREAQNREREEALEQAQVAIGALTQAVQARQADGAANEKELRDLNTKIDDLLNRVRLPKGLHTELMQQRRAYRDLIANAKLTQAAAEIETLKLEDTKLAQLELAPNGALPTLDSMAAIFKSRVNKTAETTDYLRLTLTAEITAELPSPGHENERMALQVELMNQGVRLADQSWRDLLDEWCGSGPADEHADVLRERFFNAITQLATSR